jgi:transglutaminase-like putative cysteine protease/lipoprotein NlpI
MRPSARILLTLCLAMAGGAPYAQQAQAPAPAAGHHQLAEAAARAARPAEKPGTPGQAGVLVEPEPAWIIAPPSDGAVALPPSAMHYEYIDRQCLLRGQEEVRYERLVRVVDTGAGLEPAAQIQLDFDPSYQSLVLHHVRVIRAGKASNQLDRRKVRLLERETQLERQQYDGRVTASLVLEDVRVGDRIDFSYSVRGRNPVFDGRYVDRDLMVAQRGPTGTYRTRLLAPAARQIAYRAPADAIVATRVQADVRETTFTRHALAQLVGDPAAPEAAFLGEELTLSEFKDWADVDAWARQVLAVPAQGPGVKAKAEEIAAASADPVERATLALDFVQREIRYFGTEIGLGSHRPAAPETVLRQRYGDCKDKVMLLVALLQQMQIEAVPVLASVHYRERVDGMLPSPQVFDHAIARVHIGENFYWVDATRSRQTGPMASRQPSGLGMVLVAAPGEGGLTRAPLPFAETRMAVTDVFRFEKTSVDPELEARIRYRGDLAELMRDALQAKTAEDVQKAAFSAYVRLFPQIVPRGPMQVQEVAGDNALELSMRFTVPHYLHFPKQETLTGDYGMWSLADALNHPNESTRVRPVRIPFPGVYTHAIGFEFAEDIFKEVRPARFDQSDGDLAFHWNYGGDARHQTVQGELRLLRTQIEPSDWTAFVEHVQKARLRLAGSLRIPALRLDQVDKLRADLDQLAGSIKSGRTRVVTKTQVDARGKLIVLRAMLDSGRLPPELRAEALVALGSDLDFVDRAQEAAPLFDEAIALAPDDSDALEAAATNALLRRQGQRAIELAGKALERKPANPNGARFTRALSYYFSGDFAGARADLEEILKSPGGELPRSYAALWLYLSVRRVGGDAAAVLRDFDPQEGTPRWPYAVFQVFAGTKTVEQALEEAKENGSPDPGRICELDFFVGEKLLLDGRQDPARASFRKSVDTGVTEFLEYGFSSRELAALTR